MKSSFNWFPLHVIKKIFQLSAQHARTIKSTIMKKTYRSPFIDLNIKRRNKPVATDTVYCDDYVIDDESKCAQVIGTKTIDYDVYGMKRDKQFIDSLEDNTTNKSLRKSYKLALVEGLPLHERVLEVLY